MSKAQWYNLYHAYRSMLRHYTQVETLAWIGHYSRSDRKALERVIK